MKKKEWKRAAQIAADLMSRMDACVVGDEGPTPCVQGGETPTDCEACILGFLKQKARYELHEEKLRKEVMIIRERSAAARDRAKEGKK